MATWKKLVVSGSDISQLTNNVGYITAADFPNSFATASVNNQLFLADSPSGSFSLITGSAGAGLAIDVVGTDIVFDLSSIPNATLENSSIYFTGSGVSVNQSYALGETASIDVSVDNINIGVNASNQLEILDDSLTLVKIASSSIVDSSEGIDANVDNSTVPTSLAVWNLLQNAIDGASVIKITGSDDTRVEIDLTTEGVEFFGSDGAIITTVAETNQIDLLLDTGSAHFTAGVREKISVSDTEGSAGIDMSYDSSTGVLSALLATSSLMIGVDSISLGATASAFSNLTISDSIFSGSFSGSFQGDGSGLSGLVTSLQVTASTGNTLLDLSQGDSLNIIGGANIDTSIVSGEVVVALTDDVVIPGDLTVLGTASFQNAENLLVEDRFILLASGSNTAGDGGIIIQGATQDVGEVFGFDATQTAGDETGTYRWGIGQDLRADATVFSPEAFMAAVLTGAETTSGGIETAVGALDVTNDRYNAVGNIYIDTNEGIWMYS